MTLRTIFLWSMIISLALAAGLGLFAVLKPDFGWYGEMQLIVTSLLIAGFSMLALICSFVLGKRRLVGIMWFGIAAGVVALVVGMFFIWLEPWDWGYEVEEGLAKLGGVATTAALWAAHLGLLVLVPTQTRRTQFARNATVGLASLLCLVIVVVVLFEFYDEPWGRAIAALSILSTCGTTVTPVLALIDHLKRRGSRESIPSRIEIDLVCPRCKTQQTLRAGPAKCASCGLRIDIDVEEPRCQCGYLLYQLQTDKCPECGAAIDASHVVQSS